MPDRDVQGIADFGFGSQIKAFWDGPFDVAQGGQDRFAHHGSLGAGLSIDYR